MPYSLRKTMAIALTASAIAHVPLVYPKSVEYPAGVFRRCATAMVDRYEAYKLRKERAQLIDDAREGKMGLGEFLIRGNHVDAKERGEEKDVERALARYERYRAAFSEGIKVGKKPYEALQEAAGDLNYFGIPGGAVLDALNEGGGSCAQLAPLLASLLYDGGFKGQAFIRTYGENSEGLSHDSAIFRDEHGTEYDLQKGAYSDSRGTLIPARWLIEAYAKAHGLQYSELEIPKAEKEATAGRPAEDGKHSEKTASGNRAKTPPPKPTGLDLPRGKDSFEGGAPLFAKNAVPKFDLNRGRTEEKEPNSTKANEEELRSEAPAEIAKPVVTQKESELSIISFLNIGNIARMPSSENPVLIRVHPVQVPDETTLDKLSILIERTKSIINRKKNGPIASRGEAAQYNGIMTLGDFEFFMAMDWPVLGYPGSPAKNWNNAIALGVLSGLYSEAEWNFRLAGRHALAEAAVKERKAILDGAGPILENLETDSKIAPNKDIWFLTYLGPRGDEALARYMEKSPAEGIPNHTLAVQLVKEQSRQKTLETVGKLTVGRQTRLFRSMLGEEAEGPEETLRAYGIYNNVSDRIAAGRIDTEPKHSRTVFGLRQGESSTRNGLTLRVDEITVEERSAIITLTGYGMKKERIHEGQTKDFYFNAESKIAMAVGIPNKFDRSKIFTVKLIHIWRLLDGNEIGATFETETEIDNPVLDLEVMDRIVAFGRLYPDETMNAGGYKVRFLGMTTTKDGHRFANLLFSTPSGRGGLYNMLDVGQIAGYTVQDEAGHITAEDSKIKVRLKGVGWKDGGPPPSTKDLWVDVEILANVPDDSKAWSFSAMKDMVITKSAEKGLGDEWKAALVYEIGEAAMEPQPNKLGLKFESDFVDWTEANGETLKRLDLINR